MSKTMSIAAGLALAVICLIPLDAFACACCIDPGYYERSTWRVTSNDIWTYQELKFDSLANLYESAAGFDGIKGLDALRRAEEKGEQFDLSMSQSLTGRTWRFTIRSSTGPEGTIEVPLPRTMVKFKVDIHDNEPGTEPGLYKEFQFRGTAASGTGMFRRDVVKGTSYFLILQGRGNGCDSSSDFNHWRLELTGPKAQYSFFGKLLQ
jgi:hypothetical protein